MRYVQFAGIGIAVTLMSIATPMRSDAQCSPCLSAGVKVAHTFGANGGLTWGIEASLSQWNWQGHMEPVPLFGAVLSYDHNLGNGSEKIHAGFETGAVVSIGSAGLDLGPTVIFDEGHRPILGFTLTPFVGAFTVYPFYSITFGGPNAIEELGVIAKLPIIVDTINL